MKDNDNLIMQNNCNPFRIFELQERLDEYWVSPFNICLKLTEEEFINDHKPIVIIGERGCGKTSLLRYYSYEIQKKILEKNNLKILSNKGLSCVGIYLQYDEDILSIIDKIFTTNEDVGNDIFNEYINISLFTKIADILVDLYKANEISNEQIECIFGSYFNDENLFVDSCEKIIKMQEVVGRNFLNKIKNLKIDSNNENKLRIDIEKFINCFKKNVNFICDVKFIFLFDEYEKYSLYAQKNINSIMKFINNNSQYTIRVAKSNNNFRTYDTINKDEYLKSGSDYKEVHFLNILNMFEFKYYLKEIGKKCFELKGMYDFTLEKILGYREDFIKEALEITNGKKTHFGIIGKQVDKNDLDKIIYPENPLIEMMNILYVIRNKESKPNHNIFKSVNIRMTAFLNKEQNEMYKKYKNDYSNKYRLSLLILLCKIYCVKKKYYSFNTLAYLVSGNIRLFLELLEKIWDEALANNWDASDLINSSIQSEVTYKILSKEVDRIKKKSFLLFRTLNILGTMFREYHNDYKVKYPETNQFFLYGKMSEYLKEIIDEAILEGVLLNKKKLQRKSINFDKGEVFVLNRIFAPKFQLSYRIRGGYNVKVESEDFENKIRFGNKKNSKSRYSQLSLFDNAEVE